MKSAVIIAGVIATKILTVYYDKGEKIYKLGTHKFTFHELMDFLEENDLFLYGRDEDDKRHNILGHIIYRTYDDPEDLGIGPDYLREKFGYTISIFKKLGLPSDDIKMYLAGK